MAEVEKIIIEVENTIKKIEEKFKQSVPNIEKYFDRINDKLFSYQLFLLAGYISLMVIPDIRISPFWLLIPFVCIIRLVIVDYNMMEYHRKFSKIKELSSEERQAISKKSNSATLQSLEAILESLISTIIIIVLLCRIP